MNYNKETQAYCRNCRNVYELGEGHRCWRI